MSKCSSEYPRLFLKVDSVESFAEIALWAQINLTDCFITQIEELSALRDFHQLAVVTVENDAIWCLTPGWRMCGGQPGHLDVWQHGFTVKAIIEPITSGIEGTPTQREVWVTYIWGSVDEFLELHRLGNRETACDSLDSLEGWSSTTNDTLHDMVEFESQVNAHLARNGAEPLRISGIFNA